MDLLLESLRQGQELDAVGKRNRVRPGKGGDAGKATRKRSLAYRNSINAKTIELLKQVKTQETISESKMEEDTSNQ